MNDLLQITPFFYSTRTRQSLVSHHRCVALQELRAVGIRRLRKRRSQTGRRARLAHQDGGRDSAEGRKAHDAEGGRRKYTREDSLYSINNGTTWRRSSQDGWICRVLLWVRAQPGKCEDHVSRIGPLWLFCWTDFHATVNEDCSLIFSQWSFFSMRSKVPLTLVREKKLLLLTFPGLNTKFTWLQG